MTNDSLASTPSIGDRTTRRFPFPSPDRLRRIFLGDERAFPERDDQGRGKPSRLTTPKRDRPTPAKLPRPALPRQPRKGGGASGSALSVIADELIIRPLLREASKEVLRQTGSSPSEAASLVEIGEATVIPGSPSLPSIVREGERIRGMSREEFQREEEAARNRRLRMDNELDLARRFLTRESVKVRVEAPEETETTEERDPCGPCDYFWSTDRAGRRCGLRSAMTKQGGCKPFPWSL